MNFLKSFIFFTLLIFCLSNSYAQDNAISTKPPKEKKEKKKKEKKEKKVKEKKPAKVKAEKSSSNESNEDGIDKNFGPIFNGASISASIGMNTYFGDIAAYNLFPRPSQFNEHITSAFKFSIARDIKWGLGGKLNFQRGSLIGTRKTGKNSSYKSFRNQFFDISFQVRYLLSDALFKKSKDGKFRLYTHFGIGSMWYRTQLFDTKTLNTKDFEGYIEIENTEGLAQKTLSDKTAKAQTLTIPYGLTLVYRYNHKIDIHLDFTQSTAFTDRLDAFDRSWTANDKYDYIGIGVTYNFNRTADDAPKKRKKKGDQINVETSEITPSTTPKKKGLIANKKKRKKTEDDELLNIRLKLFETQLKLFEMQYLLGK
ncbi:MAG: hypothetical protein JKY30_08905 [Flavobacteriales bacterium]|nr:hypothetical protein [Flavobacteriales bacterium]